MSCPSNDRTLGLEEFYYYTTFLHKEVIGIGINEIDIYLLMLILLLYILTF